MPLIAPLEPDQVDKDCQDRIDAGMATGMYTTDVPLRIFARAPAALRAMDEGYKAMFRRSLLDDRLRELIRLRSAQINGCAPCAASRKEDSVSDEDVACMTDLGMGTLSRREQLAVKFMTMMSTDHHQITPDTYKELAEEFTTPEIIELGWTCASTSGGHRFMHTLDILGDSEPILS